MGAAAQLDRIMLRRRRGPSRGRGPRRHISRRTGPCAPASTASSGRHQPGADRLVVADVARSRRPRPPRSPRGVIALGCEKSKRKWSGATRLPFWVTWPPSRLRSAAWSRWVALWLARTLRRGARHRPLGGRASPTATSPLRDHRVMARGACRAASTCPQHRPSKPLSRADLSGVADLAAAFAVEGRLVGQDGDRCRPAPALSTRAPSLTSASDHALAFMAEIAGEFGRAMLLGDVEPDLVRRLGARALPGGAGGGLLLGHGGVEAGAVDAEALGAQRVLGEVVGEAERVVELERGLAGQRVARAPCPRSPRRAASGRWRASGGSGFPPASASPRSAAGRGPARDRRRPFRRPAPAPAGASAARLGAEQMGVAHRAAHDPAEDIAPALVGRQHAVGDQEARGAQMIGDDPVAGLLLALGLGPGQLRATRRSAP